MVRKRWCQLQGGDLSSSHFLKNVGAMLVCKIGSTSVSQGQEQEVGDFKKATERARECCFGRIASRNVQCAIAFIQTG